MSGKVIVIINPKTGETLYEVNGVVGTKCEEITDALIRNNDVLDQQFTEEYDMGETMPDYVFDPMEGLED